MLGLLFAALTAACLFLYFIVYPVIEYYRDPKGFRRFPNLSPLSGITNLSFIYLAHGGWRTQRVAELQKTHPIIRIGPNALSFGHPRAVKDIYGHNTKFFKDGQYLVTAGTHYHLADVIDKPDHARKRKVLSSAYALKNLEAWEHKVSDKTVRLIEQFDKKCMAPLEKGMVRPDPAHLAVDYRAWTNFFFTRCYCRYRPF